MLTDMYSSSTSVYDGSGGDGKTLLASGLAFMSSDRTVDTGSTGTQNLVDVMIRQQIINVSTGEQ